MQRDKVGLHHHNLIESLITEIRNLREERDNLSGQMEEEQAASRAASEESYARAERLRCENARIRREAEQAERESEDRRYEAERISRQIEQAERYGQSGRVDQLTRKLRNL